MSQLDWFGWFGSSCLRVSFLLFHLFLSILSVDLLLTVPFRADGSWKGEPRDSFPDDKCQIVIVNILSTFSHSLSSTLARSLARRLLGFSESSP